MAAVTRRFDLFNNRTIDTFPDNREFYFYKEVFEDETDVREFFVVKEPNPSKVTTYIADPGIQDATGYDFNGNTEPTADTIVRNDGGSFIAEGYTAGQKVSVRSANTSNNNGIYDISIVAISQLTITAVGGGDAGLTTDLLDQSAYLHPSGNLNIDWDEKVRIGAEGDFELLGRLSNAKIKEFNLVMWWTWVIRRRMKNMIINAVANGWTPNERRKGAGGALAFSGVPFTNASALGDTITNAPDLDSITYDQLGLTNSPPFWKERIRAGSD